MPTTGYVRQPVLERNRSLREREKSLKNPLSKHLFKIYPLGIHKCSSALSLSSLSQSSNDSSFSNSLRQWDKTISDAIKGLRLIQRKENAAPEVKKEETDSTDGVIKRCSWITMNSDQAYISFHDECWGVPVYEDWQLFELLTLSGMLMDHNWTAILKKKELYREAFERYEASIVAKMEEKQILEIASDKGLMLSESRVRCIVDNAKCIMQVVKERGSFSSYLWGFLNHKPMVSKYRQQHSIPLRSPKAEVISKDLIRRGFRLVGPDITLTFMQAAGLTIDHLVYCFRYTECVKLAEGN